MASAVFLTALISGCEPPANVARWDAPADDPLDSPVLAAEDAPKLSPEEAVTSPPLARLFVSDEWSDQTPPQSWRAFSVLDTGDLFFYAYFADLRPGAHVARIDIVGPDGYRYQTLSMPFSTAGQADAEPTPMGTRVVLDLAVAGTHISRYSLTGVWQARLLLDAVAGPPEAEATFAIYSPVN